MVALNSSLSPVSIGSENVFDLECRTFHRSPQKLTFFEAAGLIDERHLVRPSMPQMVDLMYGVYELERSAGHRLPQGNSLVGGNIFFTWAFTQQLFVPGEGVYFSDDIEVRKQQRIFGRPREEIVVDPTLLRNKLGSKEEDGVVYSDCRRVRFVPKGYNTNIWYGNKIDACPFVIGLLGGKENAEKWRKLSEDDCYDSYSPPCLHTTPLDDITESKLRVSAFGGCGDWSYCTLGLFSADPNKGAKGYSWGLARRV